MVELTDHSYSQILKNYFHLSEFRKGQKEIISAILEHKDVLGVLPTGGGKSLCYQFIAIHTQKLVIVISPLIALMKDQVASLRQLNIPTGCVYFNQGLEEKRIIFKELKKGGSFVLFLSPERIQKEGFQEWIKSQDVALFAIDEAHCISQWGHDFRAEYAQLSVLRSLKPEVPLLALTASATPNVVNDIARQLQMNKVEKKVYGFYRPNLFYQVEDCENEDEKMGWLIKSLNQFKDGRAIVYCGTRKTTENVCSELKSHFAQVGFYHAGMSQSERDQIQENYQAGILKILVATNAFGMGVDQPDVRLVVHYNMPANIDSLYQEMGRAGRDGQPSTCLMLYTKKDKGLQVYFIESSDSPSEIKKLRWRNLNALLSYCEGSECRHSEILTYFKDSQRLKKCGHCDQCEPHSHRKVGKLTILKKSVKKAISKDEIISISTNAPTPISTDKQEYKNKNVKPTTRSNVFFKSKVAITADVPFQLDSLSEERFQKLRLWRKDFAEEQDLPSFMILHDKTLREIAEQNPQSLDELRKIKGMGDKKIEQLGWEILAELTQRG